MKRSGLFILIVASLTLQAQNYIEIYDKDNLSEIIKKSASVSPSERQYRWQQLEMTAFFHFGINTFSGQEWGDGTESPAIFNPTNLDTRQWCRVCKEAGIRLVIITAKHHDGFCLWPSRYTEHSVKNSPWKNGNGDVIKELSDACHEYKIKLGVYLSPWDRHEKTYGSAAYNDYFKNQLRELLTNYGRIDEVWFDGACGEGPNGKKQIYDWSGYYELIRTLQPGAVIAISGPDVRWVGNESGYGRETEWSVLPVKFLDQENIARLSQKEADKGIFKPKIEAIAEDLGSREKLKNANALVWYPSEVDVSIRPGWFYHQSEDSRVKSPEKLIDIYFNSVGMNSALLLNIPPDKRGLIHEKDAKTLLEMKNYLDGTFEKNLAKYHLENLANTVGIEALFDGDYETYWDSGQAEFVLNLQFDKEIEFGIAMLQEQVRYGQQAENYLIEAWQDGGWRIICKGTTIGYKRLFRFPSVKTSKVRLRMLAARSSVKLAELGFYKAPPQINVSPASAIFKEKIKIKLVCDTKDAKIFYTLDGQDPNKNSKVYKDSILISKPCVLKAVAYDSDGRRGIEVTAEYGKSKYNVQLLSNYDDKYAAMGVATLVDGKFGSRDFADGRWLGFEDHDFEAVLYMEKVTSVQKITLGCLESQGKWIFLPKSVEVFISQDGENYKSAGKINVENYIHNNEPKVKNLAIKIDSVKTRYIKIFAENIGKCPDWHPGAGGKAWLFVDEIMIE